MLFNSYTFIFAFLPVTLLVFFFLGSLGRARSSIAWLVSASLFFYGWWNPPYLSLIVASIIFNYTVGAILSDAAGGRGRISKLKAKAVLAFGIIANLAVLGYFKYANFFIDNINSFVGTSFEIDSIILPLAISFFTFQQITFLVDAWRGETREYSFIHYCLFVTFFPQLIAGPIVHHREMLPQFANERLYRFNHMHFAVGATIFFLGLFKKVILADNAAVYADPVFEAAESGAELGFFEAWGGALAYTFQLYFDFSGYSDMAIGLARMFGIRLPLNFYSPYKAKNITEFWRRWHMTLSRFLRDYVYIPLGGNRKGNLRRYENLFATMLLGGLWHGAGWTFVAWGALHGLYLILNHGWHSLRKRHTWLDPRPTPVGALTARATTFIAVVVGWVFFRAETFSGAWNILASMFGAVPAEAESLKQLVWRLDYWLKDPQAANEHWQALLTLILFLLAWFAPNTHQIMSNYRPALLVYGETRASCKGLLCWRPSVAWLVVLISVALVGLLGVNEVNRFLYFNF
jgi:D-alanyl-lipoteichoic acid acyltransferase DltB (MBOAT superfamily)